MLNSLICLNSGQTCNTPDGTLGNCINFRFCNYILNLITQNSQQRNDATETYIRQSICGYENSDPKVRNFTLKLFNRVINGKMKVCCPGLIFAQPGTAVAPSPQTTTAVPGPFIFSSLTSQTQPPQAQTQPTTIASGVFTFNPFSPAGSSSTNFQNTIATTTVPPATPSAPIVNRLLTNDGDKCGMSYAVAARIVG